MLSLEQAASELAVSLSTVRRLVDANQLATVRYGRARRVTAESLTAWGLQFSTQDIDMPVTLTGTSIGHVTIPLLCVGNGADLLVSLCADNSGTPGATITQTRVPASWIHQLSAVSSVSVPSSQAPILQ
jgi:excisionase family DNA binding protein